MNKKGLKAQALALVMVVLVVASIIGVSLFSRMAKEKDSSVDQQDSSIALSQVDAVLDFFVGADINMIEENVLGNSDSLTVAGFGASGQDEPQTITDVLMEAGVDEGSVTVDDNWCTGDGNEQVSVSLEYSEPTDFVEFQPGSVLAYSLGDASLKEEGATCNLLLRVKPVEEYSIFVLKKVYDNGSGVQEDITNYCMKNGIPSGCGSDDIADVDPDNFSVPSALEDWDSSNNAHIMTIDLNTMLSDGVLELRFIPIKGVLAVSVDLQGDPDCISIQCRPIKITAEANCNDAYRGKQMFLPGSGSLGYSTLFDYGIYDSGLFQP